MSTRRLSQNQFIGNKVDMPLTFAEGATYLAVDTKQFYMYDENELPVLMNGDSGGGDVTVTDLYGGNAVIRGGVVAVQDLDFIVWATEYIVDGIYYDEPVSGSVTLPEADGANPRIDVFVINNDGVNAATVGYVDGTPSASPVKPSLELGTQVEVSFRTTAAGETEPSEITKEWIYDENLGAPNEWAFTTNSKVLPDSITDPYRGTYHIVQSGDVEFEYTASALQSITGSSNLIFAVNLQQLSTSTRSASLSIKFRNSFTGEESLPVTITNVLANKYNVNLNKLKGWQLASIPMSEFQNLPGDFNVITFNSSGIFSMYWDWVHIQDGIAGGNADITNGIQSIVAGTGITVDNSDPKNPVVSSTAGEVTSPSGLEQITEGSNTGRRLIGRNSANYGNIGQNAVDFSVSNSASSTRGATGLRCFAGPAEDQQIGGDTNTSFGALNRIVAGTYNSSNFLIGYENTAYPWSFATFIAGRDNLAGTPGSTGASNPVCWNSIVAGRGNNMYGGQGTAMFGTGLLGGSAFTTIVGAGNVDETSHTANQFWSPNNTTANPAFIVGIGDINSSSGSVVVTTRRNGFVTWRDGTSEQPQATIAEINTRGSKAVPTVEWVESKLPSYTLYSANIEVRQQTGELTSGTLVIGQDYVVDTLEPGDDFSNVGYVSEGVVFTATGTTPTTWSNGSLVHDIEASQPNVTEHANTTGLTFNWTWTYDDGVECNITGGSLVKNDTVINFSTLDSYSVTPTGYIFSDPTKITPLGATTGNFSSTYTSSIEVKIY